MKNIKSITIDPSGFAVLHFENFEARADFMKCIPSGDPYGICRPSDDGKALAWVLCDLPKEFTITDPA